MEVKDMAEVKVTYLNSKSWAEVTREERFFCAELFFLIREEETRGPFFELLDIKEKKKQASFDVGFEVCFYRDVLWKYGERVKKTYFPQKRTFDLALMSNDDLYLIEAKAQGEFTEDNFDSIEKDRLGIKSLLGMLKVDHPEVELPKVHTIALVSTGYRDKLPKNDCFEKVVTWDEVAEAYKNAERTQEIERAKKVFNRADEVYRN